MKNKLLFSIENHLKILDSETYYAIKQVQINENEPVLFYVQNKFNFLLKNGLKNTIEENLGQWTLFLNDEENNIYANPKSILENVAFMDMSVIQNEYEYVPFVQKYLEIKKNFKEDTQKISLIEKTMNKYKYVFQKILLNTLDSSLDLINDKLNVVLKEQENCLNFIENSKTEFDENDIKTAEFIKNNRQLFSEVIELIFNLFNKAKENFMFFSNSTVNEVDFLGDIKIQNLEKEIKTLENINKFGMNYVSSRFEKRDLENKIKNLKSFINDQMNKSQRRLNYLIEWYKQAYLLDKKILTKLPKNSIQHNFIYKQYMVKKHVANSLIRRRKWFTLFSEEAFSEMKKNLDFQIKLFISNNLSFRTITKKNDFKNQVRKIINNEFFFNFDNYSDSLDYLYDRVYEEIYLTKLAINKLNKVKKEQYLDEQRILHVLKLKDQLGMLKSENAWKNNNLKKGYLETKKHSEKYVKIIQDIFANFQKIIFNYNTALIKLSEKENKTQLKTFLAKEIRYFESFNFLFESLTNFKNILFQRGTITKKQINGFLLLSQLILIFNKSDINIKTFVDDKANIGYLNKLKINLLSALMGNPKLIFISDDPKISDHQTKIEFLQTVKNICQVNNTNYVFITNNKRLFLDEYFNKIVIFDKYKEIEYGNLNTVLNHPFNDFLAVQNQIGTEELKRTNFDFIFDEVFELSENHFVISQTENIIAWQDHNTTIDTISIPYTTEATLSELDDNLSKQLKNPLDDLHFMICDMSEETKLSLKYSQEDTLIQSFQEVTSLIQLETNNDNEPKNEVF
ncbi:MAG1360 family OppF-related protein [Mycoplasmopsis iners]|uniref:MAG1360 family OppF-related protein n=1 Tax=Mycoplasmopsis iners TaxID=76630 RepID=UPI000496070D|nr:ABC transporter ATP-binding protein [Mycoplasmopsis iners]